MDRILEKLKNMSAGKKAKYLLILVICAIILAIYFSSFASPGGSENPEVLGTDTQATVEQQKADLEDRLQSALSKVEGAGDVEVVINYESTGNSIPAVSTEEEESKTVSEDGQTSETRREKTSPVTIQKSDGGDAVIVEQTEPKVKGVVVVAQGAGDVGVKVDLLNAVSTLLDIPTTKIEILKMK